MVNDPTSSSEKIAKSHAATFKRDFQIVDQSGLTMRTCRRLIEQFRNFTGRITISNGTFSVDGRSMIEMLQLATVAGTVLTIELVGQDADQLMQRITPLMANGC